MVRGKEDSGQFDFPAALTNLSRRNSKRGKLVLRVHKKRFLKLCEINAGKTFWLLKNQ